MLLTCALVGIGFLVERAVASHALSPLSAVSSGGLGTIAPAGVAPYVPASLALEVHGRVEIKTPGGTWRPVAVGAAVGINDEVRTGPVSIARLQLGSQVTVELAEDTSINVAQLSQTLSRIRLQDGRVVSEVRAAKDFRFRVQVQGNNSQAETSSGRFGVMRRGAAPAVFAAEWGTLDVTGAGKRVTLQTGEQTQVIDNGAPSAPTPLPKSLLLKLGQPPPSRMRTRQFNAIGETSPGASVTVAAHRVTPDSSGRFTDTVALVDGPNEIVVQVEDVIGRKQTQRFPKVTVDARAPNVAGRVVW